MATHTLASLTKHWDTNAQVILSPSWWMDDDGTAPTWARTNQAMAQIEVQITGATTFGVIFGTSCYKGATVSANIRIAPFAVRYAEGGGSVLGKEWTYGIRPTTGTYTFLTGLDPAKVYRIQLETTCVTDATTGVTADFEVMRQAEDVAVTNAGTFVEITGFELDAGSFQTIDRTAEGDLFKAFIIGDSISAGFVDTNANSPGSIAVTHPYGTMITIEGVLDGVGNPSDTPMTANFDERGSMACVHRMFLEQYALSNGKRLVILNASYPGAWQAPMGAGLRTYYTTGGPSSVTLQGDIPGLYADLDNRLTYRTNEASTDWSAGGDWTGGAFTPDLVFLGTFTNDCLQARFENAIGAATNFVSPTFRDNLFDRTGSTLKTILDTWTSAKVAIIYGPKLGVNPATPGLVPPTYTPIAITIQSDIETAVSTYGTYYNAAGQDARTILYFSMYDLASVTNYPTGIGGQYIIGSTIIDPAALSYHPTADDHQVYLDSWYRPLEGLLNAPSGEGTQHIKAAYGTVDYPIRTTLHNADADIRANQKITVRNLNPAAVVVRGVSNADVGDWVTVPAHQEIAILIPAGTGKGLDMYAPIPFYRALPKFGETPLEIPLRVEILRG